MRNRHILLLISLSLGIAVSGSALAATGAACITSQSAQVSANSAVNNEIAAERPQVNNPTVLAVRGPQCVNQGGNWATMMGYLNQLPIGNTGSQILQLIEQLFSGSASSCALPNTPSYSAVAGTNTQVPLQTQAPIAPSQYVNPNGGQGNSLFESIFP